MAEPSDEEVVPFSPPLQLARVYLDNAQRIGEPGNRNMIEGADLQAAHADMARTAAIVSVAASLERIAAHTASNQRRIAVAASAADTLARELHKLRELARGRR